MNSRDFRNIREAKKILKDGIKKERKPRRHNYLQYNYNLLKQLEKHLDMLEIAVKAYNRETEAEALTENQRSMSPDMSRELEQAKEIIVEMRSNFLTPQNKR